MAQQGSGSDDQEEVTGVHPIEVDMVGLQSAQARVEPRAQVVRRTITGRQPVVNSP